MFWKCIKINQEHGCKYYNIMKTYFKSIFIKIVVVMLIMTTFAYSAPPTKAVIKDVATNAITEPFAIGSGGTAITKIVSATKTLSFPETAEGSFSELTISVEGARVGDIVSMGLPVGAMVSVCNVTYTAWVSDVDTVTVRFAVHCPPVTPPPGLFRVCVIRF